jgi:hypothetical protein
MKRNKFDIDLALDTIDLTFRNYTPSVDAFEFFNIIRVFFGQDFEIPNPKFHYFIVDMLYGNVEAKDFPYPEEIQDTITINPNQVGIIATRGSAKSTVTTLFYPIVACVKGTLPVTGPLSHILILSDSQQGGARDQALIMGNSFKRSVFAQEWFESIRSTESEVEVVRKGAGPIEKRHMLIKFKGAQSGGIRSGSRNPVTGDRYALMIADDVIKNEAEAYSETIMHNVTTALTSDARNAMRAKNTQFVLINTPFHKRDPVYMMVESGGFTPLVAPICKRIDQDLKKEEFEPLWEDMHDYDNVMGRYMDAVATGKTRSFNQELMLRVSNEEDRLVTDDMIQWYDRKLLMKLLDGYSLYITTDFTTTSKAKSDFSGIALWAVSSNYDYFLLDLCLRKQELDEQYNEVFRMVSTWSKGGRAIEVGVETDGQQKAHLYALRQKMQMTNRYFSFARQKGAGPGKEGISSGSAGSKHERFRYILPNFQNRKVYFPEQLQDTADMKEALKQLKGTTTTGFSTHDDFCDLISQLGLVDIIPGSGSDEASFEKSTIHEGDVWSGIFDDDDSDDYRGSTIF